MTTEWMAHTAYNRQHMYLIFEYGIQEMRIYWAGENAINGCLILCLFISCFFPLPFYLILHSYLKHIFLQLMDDRYCGTFFYSLYHSQSLCGPFVDAAIVVCGNLILTQKLNDIWCNFKSLWFFPLSILHI